jgi:hypothetical protein
MVESSGMMNRHKRSRRILYWLSAVVGWYVYAFTVWVVMLMTGYSFSAPIQVLLLVLPIVVAFLCWIYVEGPANISRKIGEAAKALFLSRTA